VRELREELAIEVRSAEPLMRYPVEYPDRMIWLDMWIVNEWRGTVTALDGQALKWVQPALLGREDILEADQPIVAALALRAR
jgi:8-oxo-dGTP diphosphatase